MQRFTHQRDVSLREITDTAMHQLGGAGRSPFGEVVRINKHHAETTRRRIQCNPQPRRPAANHGKVILVRLGQAGQQVGASRRKRGCGIGHGVIVHGRGTN